MGHKLLHGIVLYGVAYLSAAPVLAWECMRFVVAAAVRMCMDAQ